AHLALDDAEPLVDLVFVRRGAVAADQELADVRRHRILALEPNGEVLSHEIALESGGCLLIELVEHCHASPPTIVARCATTRFASPVVTTTAALSPRRESSSMTTLALPSAPIGAGFATRLEPASPGR